MNILLPWQQKLAPITLLLEGIEASILVVQLVANSEYTLLPYHLVATEAEAYAYKVSCLRVQEPQKWYTSS